MRSDSRARASVVSARTYRFGAMSTTTVRPKKKMRLGVLNAMESPSIDLGTSRMLSARSTI